MPKRAINGAKLRQKKLAEVAWKLDKSRWIMYEVKLDSDMGKILEAIMFLAGSEGLLSGNHDDLQKNWLIDQLTELGYDKQLAIETIKKLVQRTPQN